MFSKHLKTRYCNQMNIIFIILCSLKPHFYLRNLKKPSMYIQEVTLIPLSKLLVICTQYLRDPRMPNPLQTYYILLPSRWISRLLEACPSESCHIVIRSLHGSTPVSSLTAPSCPSWAIAMPFVVGVSAARCRRSFARDKVLQKARKTHINIFEKRLSAHGTGL